MFCENTYICIHVHNIHIFSQTRWFQFLQKISMRCYSCSAFPGASGAGARCPGTGYQDMEEGVSCTVRALSDSNCCLSGIFEKTIMHVGYICCFSREMFPRLQDAQMKWYIITIICQIKHLDLETASKFYFQRFLFLFLYLQISMLWLGPLQLEFWNSKHDSGAI